MYTSRDKEVNVDFYLEKQKKKKLKNLLTEEKSYKFSGINGNKKNGRFGRGRVGNNRDNSGKKGDVSEGKKLHEGFLRINKKDIKSTNKKK